MNVQYLLLARYRAIANYIILAFIGSSESFTDADATLIAASILGIPVSEELSTYGVAKLSDVRIFPIEAEGYNETNGNGDLTLLIVIPMTAGDVNTTYTEEIFRALDVKVMQSYVVLETESNGILYAPKIVRFESDVEIIGDTEAAAIPVKIIPMSAEEILIKYENSNASLIAVKILPVDTEDVEIKNYEDAVAYSVKLIPVDTEKIEIKSYIDEIIRILIVLSMGGKGTSGSLGDAGVRLLEVLSMDGSTEEYTEAISSLKPFIAKLMRVLIEAETKTDVNVKSFEAKLCEVDEESKTETTANVSLWYLPILENNILKIRSVYNVVATDEMLEVI